MHICAWQSTDSCVTSDHCRVTLQWLCTESFLIAWNVQKRCLRVVRRSRDLRPLSRDRSATIFEKKILIAWNVQKTLFDSRPTVAWPPTTVAWPFGDFFWNFFQFAWNVQKRILTVGRWSRDLRPLSRDRSATFYKKFLIAWNVQKRCLTVGRRSRDLRPLSRDHSANLFKNFPNCLKRPKNVVWQSTDGRVTSDHCRVTVQRLFSKNF